VSYAADPPPGHQAQILAEFSDEPRGMYLPRFVNRCGIKRIVIFFYFVFLFEFGIPPLNVAACASKAVVLWHYLYCWLPTLQSTVGFVFVLTN